MSTTQKKTEFTGRELRWLADNFEQTQRMRIETGERIRAVIQGRDETFTPIGEVVVPDDDAEAFWITPDGEALEADEVFRRLNAGETFGPVPMLGRAYRRYWSEEQESESDMLRALHQHPAWEWLERIPGVGTRTAGKLLSRLDITKAPYASSFWKYCGWATVPGIRYRCPDCGRTRGYPVSYNVSGKHKTPDHKKCDGTLEAVAGPEDGVRVAQPKPPRGEKSSYDQYAKKICYQIMVSILQQHGRSLANGGEGNFYGRFYYHERAKADAEKPGWDKGRKDWKAKRKTIKLLLSHLWQVWREALDMDTPDPWAIAHDGHDAGQKIEPWEVVE